MFRGLLAGGGVFVVMFFVLRSSPEPPPQIKVFLLFLSSCVAFAFAAWFSPANQRGLAAARAAQLKQSEEDRKRTDESLVRLQKALVWWTTEGEQLEDSTRLDEYVRAHRDEILQRQTQIAQAYHDTTNPCATVAGARALARDGVLTFSDEIARYLPDESDRTMGNLAEILLYHHGFEMEVLLPKAKEPLKSGAPLSVAALLGRDLEDLEKAKQILKNEEEKFERELAATAQRMKATGESEDAINKYRTRARAQHERDQREVLRRVQEDFAAKLKRAEREEPGQTRR